MTDVKKDKHTLIHTEAEARRLYTPPPAGFHGMVGLEVEMPLYRPGAAKPEIPPPAAMAAMHKLLKEAGYDAQLEPAGVLEYASPPVKVEDAAKLVAQAREDIAAFEKVIGDHGYARAPFAIMPTTTPQDALDNKVSRERLEAALAVLNEVYPPGLSNVPLLTTGVQTSFSPKSDAELFRMAYRGYALTPLIVAAMNSSSGYAANDDVRRDDVHLRTKYYEDYGTAGGISAAFLKAANPEQFIRNHIHEVFDNPMFFAYCEDGSLMRSTKDNVLTFRKLVDMGMNTLTNYELAETFLYNDIKIANVRDAEGQVVGKRVEIRAADSGLHQPASTLLLTAALIPDGATAAKFDRLLKDYGFTGNPVADAGLLKAARKSAVEHNGRFMDVAFGTGRLRDFAADVAGLVVSHYERDRGVQAEVSKLAEVLLSGNSDAKLNVAKYPTLVDVTRELQATTVKLLLKSPGLAPKNAA
ncbi:MAG TPA: glutamate-cysteine ligase family protein [Patescibacteria group bacterium]|nr:glutamate-cysteine ligase family protein [Patescibacteria group bacterium]